MMKKLLLTLLMLAASTAAMQAQDEPVQTATPEIWITRFYQGDNEYFQYDDRYGYDHFAFGEAVSFVNKDEEDAMIYYSFDGGDCWMVSDGEPIVFMEPGEYFIQAYAQVEGKLPSEVVCQNMVITSIYDGWCFNFYEDMICYVFTGASTVMVCPPRDDIFFTGNVGENDWYQEDVAIPETVRHNRKIYTVTAVGPLAFAGCRAGEVSLPGTITSIGDAAFENSALTSIDIPAAVTSIGRWAFTGTPYLERIHVDEGNPVYDSREDCNAIIETATNTLVQACKNTVIPASVTTIGEYAFGGDLGSFGVRLPEVYTLPATVTTICDFAFRECNMKKVLIPNSVTSIGRYAFSLCENLESVDLPESLMTIGEAGFGYNSKLTTVVCRAMTPPDASNLVVADDHGGTQVYEQATLFVPNESLQAYRAHEEWGRFTRIVPFIGAGPGDMDGNGAINVKDVTDLVDMLLGGEELPAYYDVDGNGEVNVNDVAILIDLLMNGN